MCNNMENGRWKMACIPFKSHWGNNKPLDIKGALWNNNAALILWAAPWFLCRVVEDTNVCTRGCHDIFLFKCHTFSFFSFFFSPTIFMDCLIWLHHHAGRLSSVQSLSTFMCKWNKAETWGQVLSKRPGGGATEVNYWLGQFIGMDTDTPDSLRIRCMSWKWRREERPDGFVLFWYMYFYLSFCYFFLILSCMFMFIKLKWSFDLKLFEITLQWANVWSLRSISLIMLHTRWRTM